MNASEKRSDHIRSDGVGVDIQSAVVGWFIRLFLSIICVIYLLVTSLATIFVLQGNEEY